MENIKFKKLEKGYILVNYNTFKQLNPIVFDEVSDFFNGFAGVYKKDKGWNLIDINGELVYKGDIWFDKVYPFSEGFALVKYKGDWYDLNTKGELIENKVSIL